MVASAPAVAVAAKLEQNLLAVPEVEVMAWYSVSVPAAGRRPVVRVQHFGAAEKAVCWVVVFEG